MAYGTLQENNWGGNNKMLFSWENSVFPSDKMFLLDFSSDISQSLL